MGRGGEFPLRTSNKVIPPRPTTYLLMFPPPTGWPLEAGKKWLFYSAALKKISIFFFFPPLSPLKKVKFVPPLGIQKPLPPSPRQNLSDPPSQLSTPRPPMEKAYRLPPLPPSLSPPRAIGVAAGPRPDLCGDYDDEGGADESREDETRRRGNKKGGGGETRFP